MSRTLTGWSFWGTRGSRGTEAPARQPGTRVNPLQRAGPIRVRAEIPSVTRKRAFLNHASICNAGPRIELWRTLFVSRISGSGFTDPPRPASCLFLTPSMTPGKPLRLLTAGTCSITQLPRAGRSALRTTAERAAFPLARSPRVVSCKKGAWRTWWHTATWILWKNRFGWIGSGIARSWRQPNLPTAMLIQRR